MSDHHKRRAMAARQLQHQRKHRIGRAAIQIARGLVGQHAGRTRNQGTCNGHALTLASRQLGRAMRHALAQAHGAQHLSRAIHAVLLGIAANAQRHGHILLGRELGQQMMELVDKAQMLVAQRTLLLRAELVQGLAHEADAAGGGCIQPAQQVQQGGLARTRGADNRQCLARLNLQIHSLQHGHIQLAFGKALGQAACLQHALAHHNIIHNAVPPQGSRGWHASWGKSWPQKKESGKSRRSARCPWTAARWASC